MNKNNLYNQLSLVNAEAESARISDRTYTSFLKERIEAYGVNNLMDEEVLSLLTGINLEVIKKAIEDFGMVDVVKYMNSLKITKTQRRKLELLHFYYGRMLMAQHREKPILNSSSKAGEYATKLFVGRSYEAFYVICLDSQNRVNYPALVHEGTINEAPVYPRIIVETALNYRANSVVLCHNHPGGSIIASQADLEVTRKITQALGAISIKVVDHIIVADDRFMSFAERGLLGN
ncbi:JAB domain-containing protein [Ruminiclostridium cellobioparum]|uniref:JAB domain-containing protein n=1 Tax=Ruminiclostridium cellobioparum TaxID=29355 RepID=UPI0028B2134D|nr:JAB domain-containing protein [Ruminiclostridium cellobioparum]